MKITISEPNGPYDCEVDTGVMRVEIRDAFIGPMFITGSGQNLVVMMRDDGFEVMLNGKSVRLEEM